LKYVIWAEYKEPVEENRKKAMEIEKERQTRGETWTQTELIDHYIFLEGNKGITIVDTEDISKIVKYSKAYGPVLKNIRVIPVLTRQEMIEAWK